MSEGNAGVEPIVGETLTLSVAVEEVESVVGEESIAVARDVQHSESVSTRVMMESIGVNLIKPKRKVIPFL
jgi:hypothetical protein